MFLNTNTSPQSLDPLQQLPSHGETRGKYHRSPITLAYHSSTADHARQRHRIAVTSRLTCADYLHRTFEVRKCGALCSYYKSYRG